MNKQAPSLTRQNRSRRVTDNARPVIEVKDLCVDFISEDHHVQAVRHLSFQVKAGETLAIVGESGSGKSVTSLSLMRLVEQGGGKITQGELLFNLQETIVDLAKADSKTIRALRGANIAMIFQEPMTSLNPVFSVGEQIAESIRLHQHKTRAEARLEALAMLKKVRIPEAENVLNRYPHQLSGGMRQRVMIAMALSCKPNLLIADEPTTALDVTIQSQILQLIKTLQAEMNMAVIFITHDMGVVAEVADRVLVMYRGEKIEEGLAADIFANPKQTYTQTLLAAVPKLGAMQGSDLPAKFPLLNNTNLSNPQELVKPVDYSQPPILSVDQLVTRFDIRSGLLNQVTRRVHAVEKVSFDLYSGETLSLVGESGCGKSTTGRALLGLVANQGGAIYFDGQRIDQLSGAALQKLRRDIQFIFQDPFASLDPRLTVGFSIMEPLLIHEKISRQAAESRVAWLLERVGLNAQHAKRYPHEFSGGQRQRICIARALALNPKVIIADESVSALDVSIQAQVINLLLELQHEFGISLLFISHDMAVVERISHRVAVMYLGQIVEMGSRREIFEHPHHPYTKKLMAAVPTPDPARRHVKRELMTSEIPSPVRKIGDEPHIEPLIRINDQHLVAMHSVSALY
ncbi:dipeptide ABC transporter ATP-binding protein [Candidatus Schmidhempelia bombi]|uniref:Glutathione import ATP-binding protein GsiA n=1 Tax=Candidatus Schmidhempelia bombi str. Bimp TaxID=1387197 RepID=A0AB94IAY9_9GAMM|nr:dipeptide ABC transporter ATP-binding protein [Candidatus Schmidhempelia bombi]TEA26570.1 dipeptide ABC transporter ATP-binding protein [Candidatus Schmidhempelia bombi str. Bimp]